MHRAEKHGFNITLERSFDPEALEDTVLATTLSRFVHVQFFYNIQIECRLQLMFVN